MVAGDVRRFAPAQRRRRLLESNASGAALPWARLLSMQSRGVRYRRHAGELIASVAERDAMHAAHAGADDGAPPLLFAHAVSSVMSVTRTDTGVPAGGADGLPRPAAADGGVVPLCWARAGPTSSVSLRAAPGQHALLQVGLLAGARAVRVTGATLATLRTSDGAALGAARRLLPALFARRLVAGRHQLHAYGRRGAAHERVAPLRAAAACRAAARRQRLHRRAHAAPRGREAALTVRLTVHESAAAAAAATTSLQSAMPAAVPPFRPLGALGLAVDAAAVTAPYDELGSLARIAWVNSRAGIHERPPPGVAPIAAQTGGGELDKAPEVHFAFERSLAVGALGLPEQITVKGAELLAAPISVRAQVEKVQVEWRASRPVALANGTAAGVRWEAEGWARRSGPQTPPLSWRCTARAEYDGWVDLTVEIRAKSGEVQLQDVELRLPFRQQIATYGLGMGFRGGRRPARWAWSWDELRRGKRKYQRGDHAVWVGEVDGGLNVNLKGEEAEWEVPFGMEAKVPVAWSGTGGGDVLVVDEGGAAVVRARAGAHKVSPTKPLTLRFSLLITPVRDRRSGLGAHASQRYYHTKYSDWDPPTAAEVGRLGANVVTLHQGNSLNPYINYPVFANATAALRGYIQRMHTAGRRVKLYFTTKELTSWATELPLFRELGTEIVTAADTLNHRRGSSYLQEQLSNYAAAWCTHSVKGSRGGRADLAFEDQALLVNGASRWCNYYVEGVRWVLRHLKLDGIYLDGIRFPREVSQRLRHVFAAAARARGGADTRAPLLDLHAGPNLARSSSTRRTSTRSGWARTSSGARVRPTTGSSPSQGCAGGSTPTCSATPTRRPTRCEGCSSRCSRGRGGRARSRVRTRRCGRCGTTLASARPSSSDGGRQSSR